MSMNTNPKSETASRFIPEHEVTLSRLKAELTKAMIDVEPGDAGDLLIRDPAFCVPVWLKINPDRKLITIKTWDLAPAVNDEMDALRWVNAANERLELVQFHFAQGNVWGYHWMSYDDGLSIRQLVKTLHYFDKAFKEGMTGEPTPA